MLAEGGTFGRFWQAVVRPRCFTLKVKGMKPKEHKPLLDLMECERMGKSAIWSKYELERDALLTKLEEAQRLMAEVITTTSDPERGAYHPEAMAARRAAVEFFNVA